MTVCVLDIETAVNSRANEIINQMTFKPKSTIKDPAKKEADVAAKKQSRIDKSALHWITGRVCHISVKTMDGRRFSKHAKHEDEDILLTEMASFLYEVEATKIVGQKSKTFDRPFLIGRSIVHETGVPNVIKPYRVDDLDDIFGGSWSGQTDTLDNYALACSLDRKVMDSALIPDLAQKGEYDLIREHCDWDVHLTWELFRRFGL